jgi:hypothetical protein
MDAHGRASCGLGRSRFGVIDNSPSFLCIAA